MLDLGSVRLTTTMFRITADIRCIKCSYNLKGLESNRCPECGQPFDRSNPDTYAQYLLNGKNYFLASLSGPLFMILPFLGWGILDWLANCFDASIDNQNVIIITTKTLTTLVFVSLGWLISGSTLKTGFQALKDRRVFVDERKYVSFGIMVAIVSFFSLILLFLIWIVIAIIAAFYS